MTAAPAAQLLARRLGLLGGALGVVAGLVQAEVGDRIPDWSGAKADPVGLGVLTVLLSVVAVVSAQAVRGPDAASPQRRLAAASGLLIPAALCASTVGRLWLLPGALLLAAAVVAVGPARDVRPVVARLGLAALLSLLGGFELLMAVSAAPTTTAAVGVLGGLALVAVPWVPGGLPARLSLLALGTLPFMLLTWSSLATPLLAAVALGLGTTVLRRQAVAPSAAGRRVPRLSGTQRRPAAVPEPRPARP